MPFNLYFNLSEVGKPMASENCILGIKKYREISCVHCPF